MDYHGGDDMRLFGAFFLWRQYAEAGMAAAFIDDVYGRSFFCRVVSKPLFSEKQAGPLRKIPVLPNFFFPFAVLRFYLQQSIIYISHQRAWC